MAATWLVGLVNLLGLNGAGNWPNFDSSIRVAFILLLLGSRADIDGNLTACIQQLSDDIQFLTQSKQLTVFHCLLKCFLLYL